MISIFFFSALVVTPTENMTQPANAESRLAVINLMLDLEDRIARDVNLPSSPRDALRSLNAVAYGKALLELTPEARTPRQTFLAWTRDQLSGYTSRGEGMANYIGIDTTHVNEKLVDQDVADQILNSLFRPRRQEFRSTFVAGLMDFVEAQGVIYDSFSYQFTNSDPQPINTGDSVRIVGYLDSIPSFMLEADVQGRGIVTRINLYPGVLVDQRYPLHLTAEEALAIARTREPEEYPLSWENVVIEFTYSDLKRPGYVRGTVQGGGWDSPNGRREAYPRCYVRRFSRNTQGTWVYGETYIIDAVTKQLITVLPPVLVFGDNNDQSPQLVNLRLDGEFLQLISTTIKDGTTLGKQMSLNIGALGFHQGQVSTDGHYVRLLFGDYYSPKPIKTTVD